MTLEVKTSVKNSEIGKQVLAHAIESLKSNPGLRKSLDMSHNDLTAAERFLKAVEKALDKNNPLPF